MKKYAGFYIQAKQKVHMIREIIFYKISSFAFQNKCYEIVLQHKVWKIEIISEKALF